jgi:haloacid dehalogenase-like hydrolase
MGKPFRAELQQLRNTYQWALSQPIEEIRSALLHENRKPLFIVGSGGSLSVCHYLALLYQQNGMMAKAITPLELFYSKQALRESNVLFVSASGKNTDILFGYKTAVSYEPNKIFSICMKKNSPLAKLASSISISKHFDFNLPSGKDGFLATNSLIAFFTIICKVFTPQDETIVLEKPDELELSGQLSDFFKLVTPEYTFAVLHSGWGQSVAVDMESKLAEAALGDILISDYRNFGHGRHHWFDKRGGNSAIIALVSPAEEQIASRTLELMPKHIPILKISTQYQTAIASIDLLIKSFYFVQKLGEVQNIDPGRPGVPDYGRKLYHLNYQKLYSSHEQTLLKTAICRKADIPSFDALEDDDKNYWTNAYKNYVKKLTDAKFGSIIFDYDGTLCSSKNRYKEVDDEISACLNTILSKGFVIGIATGRGKSVRTALQLAIKKEYWRQVIVGYYNCGETGRLYEDHLPDKNKPGNLTLEKIAKKIKSYEFPIAVNPKLKPNQLVIAIDKKSNWDKVRLSIIQLVINMNIPGIQILESSHSMDIVDLSETNKLNIIDACLQEARERNLAENFLCAGDKGKWPGNDYLLLSSPYSLSVDEVSALTDSCWNLSPPGIKNIDSILYYISRLQFNDHHFQIKL